ncbi:MAG: hypothetical protein QOF24_79 [Verrucomicrobiota bacterium]|jgi:hypothetical protein
MKRYPKLTWVVLLTIACSAAANAEGLKGRIVGYGTYTVTNNFRVIETPSSSAGVARAFMDPPTFTSVTDRIRAKVGVRFGIVFELTNLPKIQNATVGIVLVRKHPPWRSPDGATSTHLERSVRMLVRGQDRIVSWTGIGFDHDYEVVPGIWTFEVRSYSRLLCKKDFTVVRN